MNIDEILKLVNAGFTKDEIFRIVDHTEPEKEPEAKQEPETEEKEEVTGALETTVAKLAEAVAGLQKANINRDFGQQEKEETGSDILTKILVGGGK